MNSTLRAALDAGLAGLSRVVATPSEPFGYGTDVACADALLESMEDVTDPRRLLGEALARRLDCPRGALPDDPDYGVDLREALHHAMTDAELRARTTACENELRKDDRVLRASVALTPSPTGDRIAIRIVVVPRDSVAGGPFTLTLALTSAGIVLEEMSQ